jgi:hypothetical protein
VTEHIESRYRAIERGVEKMKLGFSHLLFVRGAPGIGKSFQIEANLKRFGLKYVEVNGDTSDAYLYRALYENNGKVIWFKDVVRLLKNLRSIDLLKSACESIPKRLITNLNYSDKQADLPKQFVFTGRLIFDFNSLVGLKFREDFEALASRGDFVDLVFSLADICALMRQVCKDKWQQEVTEFLIKQHRFAGHNGLNLRTQYRAFQSYKYAEKAELDWRRELQEELWQQRTHVQKILYPVLGDGPERTRDVKRYLIRSGIVSTVRTADRRIADWIEIGDLFRVSDESRNFLVSLSPIDITRPAQPCPSSDTSDINQPGTATCDKAHAGIVSIPSGI